MSLSRGWSRFRGVSLVGLALWLSACSTYHAPSPTWVPSAPPPANTSGAVTRSPEPEAPRPPAPPVPAPVVKATPLPSAAKSLLATADQLADSGRPREAIAQAERAQRMAPRSPEVYLSLGQHYMALGDYGRAEQFSLRAAALAAGQDGIVRQAWLQVAEVRMRAGNNSGAAEARERASR